MCSLVWAFGARICDKYQNIMNWRIHVYTIARFLGDKQPLWTVPHENLEIGALLCSLTDLIVVRLHVSLKLELPHLIWLFIVNSQQKYTMKRKSLLSENYWLSNLDLGFYHLQGMSNLAYSKRMDLRRKFYNCQNKDQCAHLYAPFVCSKTHKRTHVCTYARTCARTRTNARTHTHTQTNMYFDCVTLI